MKAGGVVAGDGGKSTMSGAKGFAIVLGGMLGVIGAIWILSILVAP